MGAKMKTKATPLSHPPLQGDRQGDEVNTTKTEKSSSLLATGVSEATLMGKETGWLISCRQSGTNIVAVMQLSFSLVLADGAQSLMMERRAFVHTCCVFSGGFVFCSLNCEPDGWSNSR